MRRIIQIATTDSGGQAGVNLFALCEDGTLWYSYAGTREFSPWQQMEPVPEKRSKRPYPDPFAPEAVADEAGNVPVSKKTPEPEEGETHSK